MRVATYTQPAAVTRGSLAALSILVATIVLGTTVVTTLTEQFAPVLSGLVTYAWLGLYVLAFLGLMFERGVNWISWLVRYRILLVLLLLGAVLSVAWSVDPRVSSERVVHLLGTSLLGIYFGFTVPLLTTLRVFAVVLGGIMLASVAAALALPELGVTDYEGQLVWRGVTSSKNHLGFWAATGVLLYATLSDSTRSVPLRLLCYAMTGLCLALLAFSHSATSLLAMLVGGALALYLYIANRFRLGFVRMAVLAVLFMALLGFAAANIDTAELVGRSDDLTGRGEVWRQTWKLIMERPLSGYGYGSLWFPTTGTLWIQQSLTDFTWIVHHAHNGFLQIASEIGLPLAVVALLMIAQQVIEIVYCQYQRQQVGTLFVLGFVGAFLIGNFSEARFLVTREFYWILFVALPISMLRQINLVSDEAGEVDETTDEDGSDGTEPSGPDGGASGGGHGAGDRGRAGRPPAWADVPVPLGAGAALVPAAATAGEAAALGPYAMTPVAAAMRGAGTESADRPAGRSVNEPVHGAALGEGDGIADRTSRWDDDDGWGDDTFDDTTGVFETGTADIDLGGDDLGDDAPTEPDRDATQVLSPDDWIAGQVVAHGDAPDDRFGVDRFDIDLDGTGDGTGDWGDVPLGGRR